MMNVSSGDVTGGASGTTAWMAWSPHRCMIDECKVVAANQHMRRERSACLECGTIYERTIRWGDRSLGSWERVSE